MSGLEGEVPRSFFPLRTRSKPEAIEAREKEAAPEARPDEPAVDPGARRTAEILPPPLEAPALRSPQTVAIIVALALAIVYLIVMLVLAASSPLMV